MRVFKFKWSIFIFIILFLQLTGCSKAQGNLVHVDKGVLNLSQWDFNKDGLVKLDGQWEFYWDQLLTTDDFKEKEDKKPKLTGYIKVPGIWTNSLKDKKLPKRGFGTYRLIVKLDPSNDQFGIKTTNIRMDSKIFINGVTSITNGSMSGNNSARKPANTPQVSYFNYQGDKVEIIVQVGNEDYKNGGIIQNIYFGPEKQISNKNFELIITDLVLIVSLIMISLIQFIIFIASGPRERQNLITLILSMDCLINAITHGLFGEKLLFQIVPWISSEILYKTMDISIACSYTLEVIFFMELGIDLIPRFFVKSIIGASSFLVLFMLLTPMRIYAPFIDTVFVIYFLVLLFMILFIMLAIYRKNYGILNENGMVSVFLVFVFLLIYVINISLYNNSIAYSYVPGKISVLLYVSSLSFLLASRYAKSYSEIKIMSEKLLAMDRLKDEFLANTTHELQTPLNGIINISETMLEGMSGCVNEKQKQNLSMVITIGKRLSELINDILELSKLKRNEIKLVEGNVDIKSNLNQVRELFHHLVNRKNIKIEVNVPDDFPNAYADENRLQQVLYNLIGNAVKFTEKGTITVVAKANNNRIKITVEDTGIGIPLDKKEDIFESFQQVTGATTRAYGGTGLGLSISRRLAELMGGALTVEWSELGKGSRFAFTVPESKSDSRKEHSKLQIERKKEQDFYLNSSLEIRKGGKCKILVVDDEVLNLHVVLNLLANEDCDIFTATSGQEALNIIKNTRKIDLVLLDVMMPKMSGYEVCRKIREDYSLIDLPVLIITARNTPRDVEVGFEAGANDFVTKPFDAKELRARVHTLLALKKSMDEALAKEMAFLQSQIKPHFLYNAMSTIMNFCYTDGEKAGELLGYLSEYLRKSFDIESTASSVSLKSELELTRAYTEIEKARFGERLNMISNIDEALLNTRILPLTIQPLVENAIRHGILTREAGGTVALTVQKIGTVISICVEDDGIGMRGTEQLIRLKKPKDGHRVGVGLPNIQRRLRNEYSSELTIESVEGKGTKVTFTIPCNSENGEKYEKFEDFVRSL